MSINRTSAEQESLCNAWKQSGLSKVKFCKQSNISKSALYAWLSKFKDNVKATPIIPNTNPQAVKFLRVNDVSLDKNLHCENYALEATIPNGITIKVNIPPNNLNVVLLELLKWK